MIRLYNKRLTAAAGMALIYDEARRQLIREQASQIGLRCVTIQDDSSEAFDGDIRMMSTLLTRLLTFGLTGFHVVATEPDDLKALVRLCSPNHPFQITASTAQSLYTEEY